MSVLLVAVLVGLAGASPSPTAPPSPVAPPSPTAPPAAPPAPCDVTAALAALRAYQGEIRAAYMCLATSDDGLAALVGALDALDASPAHKAAGAPDKGAPANGAPPTDKGASPPTDGAGPPTDGAATKTVLPVTEDVTNLVHGSPSELIAERTRLTRAIALWLLCHPDGAWAADVVRRLGADDRRLLADGVHAVRGRTSPAPEHAKVFAQFPWYQPSPRYTDRLLSDTDRANIALADDPPAPPPPPPEPAADLTPAPASGPTAKGMCGCAETPSGPASWALLGLAGLALASRRR